MALANSSVQTPIASGSTASLFRTAKEVREEKQITNEQHVPRLLQRHRTTQLYSAFSQLPEELESLILSACSMKVRSGALLNLGQTSKYFHLRVRDFIENDSRGQAFRRTYEERKFVELNGCTPLRHAKRGLNETSLLIRSGINTPGLMITNLMTQTDPAVVRVPPDQQWLASFEKALCHRKASVTVFNMRPKADDSSFLVKALETIPRGAYAALLFGPEGLPAEHTQLLAKAMKENPVVCYVVMKADDPALTLGAPLDLSLLASCAAHGVEGAVFRLEYANFGNAEAKQLADTLSQFNTTISLELDAVHTSQESMDVIIEAVRSINQAAPGKVSLLCNGNQTRGAVDLLQFRELAKSGIRFDNAFLSAEDSSINNESSDDDRFLTDQTNSSDEDSCFDNEGDLTNY